MADISKDILQKIKKDEVRPYPKQYFLVKRSVIWTVFGLSILFGSIAGAIAIFQLRYAEWDLYKHLSHRPLEFALLVIPFFWLIFLLGFTGFALYNFRHTEQGYRYRTLWVILGSMVLSVIGGGILYATGLSERLETAFEHNVPFYRDLQERKQRVCMSPEHGLLAGKIVKIISEQKIQIEDLQGNIWMIDIGDTIWKGRLIPAQNLRIKIIGEMKGQNRFIANEIRSWRGRGDQCGNRDLRLKGKNKRQRMMLE